MKKSLIKIALATSLLLPLFNASAEQIDPFYFDMVNIEKNSNLASNFINNTIRDLGGIERVKIEQAKGNDLASMVLGYIFLHGHVYEQNIDLAEEILSNAAHHHGYSSFLLGKHLLDMEGLYNHSRSQKIQGAQLVSNSANNNITEAQYLAGILHITGQFLPEDRTIGMIHIKSAAYNGHGLSRRLLSDVEDKFYRRDIDFDKIQKMATEGHVESIVELALLYRDGWKVTRDIDKSNRLLRLAANRGSDKARTLLLQESRQ